MRHRETKHEASLPARGLTLTDLRALGICKVFEVARQFQDVCETKVKKDREATEFVITFKRR